MGPFLALITPIGGDGGGTPQPPPYPSHPWVPPQFPEGPPVAGWPGVPGNWPSLPGSPRPPVQPPYPSHPIAGGPWPTFPIHYPPGTRPPWAGGPQPPIVVPPNPPDGIWGPGDPRPTLPIAGWNPGTGQFPEGPGGGGGDKPPKFEAKIGWSEQTGWVVVFVPAEGTLVPTPSEQEQKSE
jgi:hypothetical protein